MAPHTVTARLHSLSLSVFERVCFACGYWLAAHPAIARWWLLRLERAGFPGVGWALAALEVCPAPAPAQRSYATRALVLGWVANACLLVSAVATLSAWRAFQIAGAWFTGFAFFGALTVFRERRELDRRMAAARARQAELAELELELGRCTDEVSRVALLERLCKLEVLPVLALVLLVGCDSSVSASRDLDHPACLDSGAELELPEADPILLAPAADCEGLWLDADTAFQGHPDTGVCTFACEPRLARLEYMCAALGGTCEPGSDDALYCEAAR